LSRWYHFARLKVYQVLPNRVPNILNNWSDEGLVMSMDRQAHSATSIVSCDHVEYGDLVVAAGPSANRLVTIWGSKIFMMLVIAAGMTGLSRFASHVNGPDQRSAESNEPGAGIIVRAEALHIWLPSAFLGLAKRQSTSDALRSHQDLRTFLELGRQQNLWYAMTVRSHLANGSFIDVPYVRQPYGEPNLFFEFLDVLGTATEDPPCEPDGDCTNAVIHIVPDEILKCERQDVLTELRNHPYKLDGLTRRGGFAGP
jgi:hypothetical protein